MSSSISSSGSAPHDLSQHGQEEGKHNNFQRDYEVGPDGFDSARIEKVYRKLDRRVIPAFWLLYFLCSAIRSNVRLAQTMNVQEGHDLASELPLTPKQVSTGLALFYVCYVSAIVSGLGNLGSILTTYALYTGWPEDTKGPHKYRKSNLIMAGILGGSILSAGLMMVLLRAVERQNHDVKGGCSLAPLEKAQGNNSSTHVQDFAAMRSVWVS